MIKINILFILNTVLGASEDDLNKAMMKEANDLRKKEGFVPLKFSDALQNVAQEQADYMAEVSKLTHASKNLTRLTKRIMSQGVHVTQAGENIAKSTTDAYKSIINLWVNSKQHRKNLVGDFTHTAVAHATINLNGDSSYGGQNLYWVQVFAKITDDDDDESSDSKKPQNKDQTKTKLILLLKNKKPKQDEQSSNTNNDLDKESKDLLKLVRVKKNLPNIDDPKKK